MAAVLGALGLCYDCDLGCVLNEGRTSIEVLRVLSNLDSHLCYDSLLDLILQLVYLFIRK
jgi:hypothetical protein